MLLAGRNSARPFTGELVFSQKLVVLAHPSWPTKLGSLSPQVRSEGEERVYVSEDWERQTWSADICYTGTEEFRQARDLIRRASQQGQFPMVFIPDDQDPEVCLYGRISASSEMDQAFIDTWDDQEFTVKGRACRHSCSRRQGAGSDFVLQRVCVTLDYWRDWQRH